MTSHGDRSMARPFREDPPAWRTPLIVVVVILLAVAIGLAVAVLLSGGPRPGSSAAPSASVSTSASTPPSAAPSVPASGAPAPSASAGASSQPSEGAGPAPVVEPPTGFLPPGSFARVVVDGLRVREGPTTGAAEVTTLGSGTLVAVGWSYLNVAIGYPEADGFTWIPVSVLGLEELPTVPHPIIERSGPVGWVAGGDESGSFLQLVAPRCTDAEPTLEIIQSLVPWEQLACYGDRQLTLEGVFGCGGCGSLIPGTFEPAWLSYPESLALLSVEPNDTLGPFSLRFPPDVEAPEPASILRVTGHFDDPRSAECTMAPGDPPEPMPAELAVLACRERFVVESFEVLGTDEDFPFS